MQTDRQTNRQTHDQKTVNNNSHGNFNRMYETTWS